MVSLVMGSRMMDLGSGRGWFLRWRGVPIQVWEVNFGQEVMRGDGVTLGGRDKAYY